jgi:hypothetical protein
MLPPLHVHCNALHTCRAHCANTPFGPCRARTTWRRRAPGVPTTTTPYFMSGLSKGQGQHARDLLLTSLERVGVLEL